MQKMKTMMTNAEVLNYLLKKYPDDVEPDLSSDEQKEINEQSFLFENSEND